MARKWISHVKCLPPSTERGLDRRAYHRCLVDQALEVKAPGRGRPVAILTMGGSGSGKSTIVESIMRGRDFVRSDPDDIKAEIPEYALAVAKGAKDAAFMVHDESSRIADRIAKRAIRERKNLIIDGTGKNLDNYLANIRRLRRAGYHVTVVGADVPVDLALKRVEARAEATGRYIPANVVRDIYKRVPCNVEPIAQASDEFLWFSTTGKKPKLLMKKSQGNKLKVLQKNTLTKLAKKCSASKDLRGGKRAYRLSEATPAVKLNEIVRRIGK